MLLSSTIIETNGNSFRQLQNLITSSVTSGYLENLDTRPAASFDDFAAQIKRPSPTTRQAENTI